MAGRLYIDAVERQSIPPNPEIMAYLRLPSEAAMGSQEAQPSQHSGQVAGSQSQAAAMQRPKGGNKRQQSAHCSAVSFFIHSFLLQCSMHICRH